MRIRDVKIGTQLRLGLAAVLLGVGLLGGIAWYHAESMWLEVDGLYRHPMTVRRALGDLKGCVLTIHRGMKDLVLVETEKERDAVLQAIEANETVALQQIAILRAAYLGPRSDVDEVDTELGRWRPVRVETLRILNAGQKQEALRRSGPVGAGGEQVDRILGHLDDVSRFAQARADRFYQDAARHRSRLHWRLGFVMSAVLALAAGVGGLLFTGIRRPLAALTGAAERFGRGERDARCGYVSGNEFGALSAAFNALADTVQADGLRQRQAARLAEALLREEDPRSFMQSLVEALARETGSEVGALYVLNEAKSVFERSASIGLGTEGRASFSAAEREGEWGGALATGRPRRIAAIPEDTPFTFGTASGVFRPREILTLPLSVGAEVVAVVSLASLREYSASAIRLVEEQQDVISARLGGVLAGKRMREFSALLERQNRELEQQQRELAAQTDELSEQNLELEMQKRQLDQASQLKSRFLSNMSHELRTPLNSVIVLAEVLGRRLKGAVPAEEYGYLEVIERNGRHLLSLINEILDLARIEAGREQVEVAPFAVGDLMGAVLSTVEPEARQKNLALVSRWAADLPPLVSDFAKCRHIVQNLVGNAVKFTEAGRVEVAAEAAGEEFRIEVKDTGIGIAVDQLPHIFDEFRQADDSTSRKYGGTGLGLAIAQKYASLLGGRIEVESAPGQGSTFTLRLPLKPSGSVGAALPPLVPEGVAVARPERPQFAVPGGGRRILLVEDSEPAIVQMSEILTAQGYRVEVARDGQEALRRVGEAVPDAAILDLMMPGVDGFQVLRALRASAATARLPVLILTARHVSREELAFLKGNHIHQLIRKGELGKAELLRAIEAMVVSAPAAARPAPSRSAAAPPTGKPTILVVEDRPDNLRTVRALLDDTAVVIEATDGRAAVALAREHRPHLILMDLSLPILDGFQALAEIRRDPALDRVPVVALTARAMKGDREDILSHGFDAYLAKPIDEPRFRETLRELLYGRDSAPDPGDRR